MSSDVAKIKNSTIGRRINRLFGEWKLRQGDTTIKRFFPNLPIPVFYRQDEIPSRANGLYFVWRVSLYEKQEESKPSSSKEKGKNKPMHTVTLVYIGATWSRIKTKIKRLKEKKTISDGDVVSVVQVGSERKRVIAALARMLIEELDPEAQWKRPARKAIDWEKDTSRFWAHTKIQKDEMAVESAVAPDDCTIFNHAIWTGARSGRYGMFRLGGKVMSAHRAAYILTKGPIPYGAQIRTTCKVRLCCNPLHLVARAGFGADETVKSTVPWHRSKQPSRARTYIMMPDGSLEPEKE